METYPVKKVRTLKGTAEAKERFAERMVKQYTLTITHLSPIICPCYGCKMRRKWQGFPTS